MSICTDLCLSTAIITLLLIGLRVRNVCTTCASPQYAEYGHRGIIECNFMSGFTGVFWYLYVKSGYQIVIRLEKQEDGAVVRSGEGYTEGKFDILSNGSLIISNISTFHNQTFKVVHLDENLRVKEFYVVLLTTVLPDPKFPLISVCNKTNLCLIEDIDSGILTCSYNHSKPPVELAWYRLSHEGTEPMQGETIVTEDGDWTFSSVSKTNISNDKNGPLIAFSCRASSPAFKAHFMESVVIIDTTKQPWPSLQGNVKEEKYFIRNSEAGILCTDSAIPPLFVWKELQRNSSHILGFAASGKIRTISDTTTRWTISHDGSLIFSRVNFEDKGLYSCTFPDGIKCVSNLKQVNVFVPPDPPTIIVKECPPSDKGCEILIRDKSPLNISCYLNGVYPNVTLNMESTLETELRVISQTTHPVGRGKLYNATITKEIPAIDCSTSLNLTCKISSPVFRKFIPEKFILLRSEECKKTEFKVAAVVIPIFIITVITGSVFLVFFLRRHNFCRQEKVDDGIKENNDITMESDPFIAVSGDHSRVEHSKSEPVNDRRQDLLELLHEFLNLIMSYPMNYANNKQLFHKEAIDLVRDNPVNIQLKKDVGRVVKYAGGALTVAGAALALFTLGFGAVLVLAGAAVGISGVGIGLSSKELFKDPSKWRKVKPVFETLIELLKSMAQAIATASSAHQALEYIRNEKATVHEKTLKDARDEIKILINKHKENQSFTQTDLIKKFHEIRKDTQQLLKIIERSYDFTSFHLDEGINMAMESPFKILSEDALTCIHNYGSEQEANSFVNFIRLFFIGDKNGELPQTSSLEKDFHTERANENTTTTIAGIAAAGIVLNAAEVKTDVKFLGSDLEKLLGQKEEHNVALTDTAKLMEKMNAVFAKLNK